MGRRVFSALVGIGFLYLASPLLLPVTMGAVLAVLFSSWMEKWERTRLPSALGAAFLTLGITLVLILPMSMLLFFAVKSGFHLIQSWKQDPGQAQSFAEIIVKTPKMNAILTWVTERYPVTLNDLASAFQDFVGSLGAKMTEWLGGMLAHLPSLAVGTAVIIMSVYFFLLDGKKLVFFLRRSSVFSPSQTEQLIETVGEMCHSVILAALVSGGIQALTETITCILTGVPHAALVGLLVFVGSFIPLVGALPITAFVAIQQLVEGNQVAGITLVVMALVLVGIDNTVRPLFLKGRSNLHPLLGFVAAFGGLQILGFWGVFLGPILAALFVQTARFLIQDGESDSASL